MIAPGLIASAFLAACADELAAPKPGNVHLHAGGHGMGAADFLRSAAAAAPALCQPGAPLGARILGAVRATRRAVGQNTNLGIVLLCAPLAMAAGEVGLDTPTPRPLAPSPRPWSASRPKAATGGGVVHQSPLPLREGVGGGVSRPAEPVANRPSHDSLQRAVRRVIASSTRADAAATFRAIALAAPGGLGTARRYDVRVPARVSLPVAMAEAAARDRIAAQWTSGFADIFDLCLQRYAIARARWPDPRWATLAVYLGLLAAFPDSHVARRHGARAAIALCARAAGFAARLDDAADPSGLLPDLLAWDASLKRRRYNPGTSADLTVATLFAARLQ